MRLLVIVIGVLAIDLVPAYVHDSNTTESLKTYEVKDTDFENTNVEKICLLAQLNASIVVAEKLHDGSLKQHKLELPQNAATDGSFCNIEYESLLKLIFDHNSLTMKFVRTQTKTEEHQDADSYCDKCDWGTWTLTEVKVVIASDDKLVTASIGFDNIKDHAVELTGGIEVKRAFKCNATTDRTIALPLHVHSVVNSTSKQWTAEIIFHSIQLQPFMVFQDTFYDPYLCRDVTGYHIAIILIPLAYFAIFIAFHRIKNAYGCPPNFKNPHKKLEQDSCAQMVMEPEESTNIMSGEYSGSVPIGMSLCVEEDC